MNEVLPYQDTRKAWIPVLGAFFVHFLTIGTEKAFSVWFVEIMDVFHSSASTTSGILGLNSSMRLLLGPIAVMLSSIFGLQIVVICGGFLSLLGLAICSITRSFVILVIGYSFVFGMFFSSTQTSSLGLGLTLVFTPSLLVCTTYFKKKRSIALSLSLTGAGFGAFALPTLVSYLIKQFGYHGAMLINSSILFHFCVSGALYYPLPDETNETDQIIQSELRKNRAINKFKTQLQCGSLLNDKWFMIFVSGFIFNMMGSVPVTTLIVDNAITQGVSCKLAYSLAIQIPKEKAISLLAIEGVFQVISRLASGFLFGVERFHRIRGFIWCSVILCSALIIYFIGLVKNFYAFAVIMALRGCFLAIYIAQQTLITTDMVEGFHSHVNQAIGLTQFSKGVGTLIGSYLSGEQHITFEIM
ncbi:hypothetical protein Ciccas_002475 [Cichlidogyrus casuarinus]|uniref:Uncharacterized protein n=1 Tax=Cichlidogyrus casuarinus TaxID=1844966 RepID=A0ABD2QH54_9PLAT